MHSIQNLYFYPSKRWDIKFKDDNLIKLSKNYTTESLNDVNLVDDDGKAVVNPLTGKQEVLLGLKSTWINITKETAQQKLNEHDWMVVRNAEKSTAIPSDVTTYRDAIRTKCASIETAINNCSSHADFMKLFDTPSDGSNPPINDFPDEI